MNVVAAVANGLWVVSNVPAWLAFRRALARPAAAQAATLQGILRQASRTAFGRAHGIDESCTCEAFRRRVPLQTYDTLSPWIDRIRAGETRSLTVDPVRRLATTSGTTSGRKLIPHTVGLQRQFNQAIGPWIVDLFRTYPSLLGGRAYWSISPAARQADPQPSAVPIGFEDDGEYLGGLRRRLVESVLAVPPTVRHAATIAAWQTLTVEHLRRAKDLRLISIWHPSFLDLLPGLFDGPADTPWPRLRVISCWADAHAALPARHLAQRFPGLVIQAKGLMATEGVVSIPFEGKWPLAIRSHFFEFLTVDGQVLLAHELEDGRQYEVVLTTAGGLYRYRLGDLVRVEGFCSRTPSVRFVGRAGNVSDRFGEKLDEPFVTDVLRQLRGEAGPVWRFAMLAPAGDHYDLFVEGDALDDVATRADALLRQNPHYAYCRDLGQLKGVRLHRVTHGDATYVRRLVGLGQRLGDIKPAALSKLDGWAEHFVSGQDHTAG